MPRYKSLTSWCLGLASGEMIAMNSGDLLPDDWVAGNPHQIHQLLEIGTVVRLPDDKAAKAAS